MKDLDAKALRDVGFEIPEQIPDCAVLNKHAKFDVVGTGHGEGEYEMITYLELRGASFSWVEANIKVDG